MLGYHLQFVRAGVQYPTIPEVYAQVDMNGCVGLRCAIVDIYWYHTVRMH